MSDENPTPTKDKTPAKPKPQPQPPPPPPLHPDSQVDGHKTGQPPKGHHPK